MNTTSDVLFEEISGRNGNIGLITLNRPQVLNALNQSMFIAIENQLSEWESTDYIKAVIIRASEGRAFCAGGDIRSAYERKKANDPGLVNFFRDEYRLNRHIHHYSKPYIALLDGITMGGGAGVSLHGSHRVGTDKLIFAMPETGIGFFPDVGTTYYLSRLPYKIGFYLGLTGARIQYNDCYTLGLIDEVVPSACFPELIYAIANAAWETEAHTVITEVIQAFATVSPESVLFQHRDEIARCFGEETVEGILHTLEKSETQWCHEVAALLKTKSPTSLKVTLSALREAEKMDFDRCIEMEYRLTNRFLQQSDFFEGIRAVVIDKDQAPEWHPAQLEDVSVQEVKTYFAPLEKELVE